MPSTGSPAVDAGSGVRGSTGGGHCACSVILGYYEDGSNLVTLAMNGWANAEPAWWLNLKAHPEATVDLADGSRLVRARAAEGEERSRLWARWRDMGDDVDAYATLRSSETAVVILEPLPEPGR